MGLHYALCYLMHYDMHLGDENICKFFTPSINDSEWNDAENTSTFSD